MFFVLILVLMYTSRPWYVKELTTIPVQFQNIDLSVKLKLDSEFQN